ncbi:MULTISPECIES: small ribosomal subunit Rsm22 family protein [Clostridium]|uniref:small ribosomal subunit Rsm22 family protein n=1 Tax=Clostridium TaxID=1485 RepID=UPI00069CF11E|nr:MULTISPECIES: small ribosomal subunit Rsm22 family protein [Clostridium]KOF57746.1 ribosomal small subunit Rsm22 [Clostridium sp. DMHC 10]MCD2348297.1 small ribosomal subunit Rsm22 family protein [Clostridium guangxiense]
MELPIELKLAIENQLVGIKHSKLAQDAQTLSKKYRTESGHGKRLLTESNEAVAYSVVRMPATYGAVYSALKYTLDLADCNIESLLDVGAGTGAASWAADSLIDLKSIVCLERENAMREVGQKMMSEGSQFLRRAKWIEYDLTKADITEKADLVIASYVLNELDDDERMKAAYKLWKATNKITLIIEPGTPVGYSHLKKIREYLLGEGAHIVAPCSHENNCPLEQDDWCHFTCRVQRSKLHRQLKEGEVPYEDEKFAYLAISREPYRTADARILRHPITGKGRITLDICSIDGIKKVNIFKRDGDLYKKARKAQCGDEILIK